MNRIIIIFLIFFIGIFSAFSQEKKYIKYYVQEGETVQSISQKLLITPHNLLKLNPDLKDGIEGIKILIIPNKNYKPTSPEEHIDYVKNGFLYHKVLPKENFFGLKRQYGVNKKTLRRHNPLLRRENLKVGQIIKIPVNADFTLPESSNEAIAESTKPYLVKPKETKYSIAKKFGIDISKLVAINPHLEEEVLKIGEIIQVPNTTEIPKENEDYVIHKVEKGDTFFNLRQRFGVSVEDLLNSNPDLQEGLKLGMLIQIPLMAGEEQIFTPVISPDKEIKALLLLPFMSNKASVNFEKNRTSDIVSDFYLGASMALDSLKKQGVSLHVKVFDTQNNKNKIQSIFSAVDLSDTDIIIGPMFYSNLEHMSGLIRGNDIPLISPVSRNDHTSLGIKNIIQEAPSKEALSDKVLSYISENYKNQNFLIISDTAKASQPFLNKALSSLKRIDSINKIEVIKPEKGYIKPEIFREKLLEDKENWVLLISEDAVVTRDVINNLGVLPEEIKTTFFTLNKGKNFDAQNDINNYLAHVNFHYPTHSFIDYEDKDVKHFISKYKSLNHAEPGEYAFKGFDITYDALLRVASYEDISEALNAGVSERMSTKFNYKSNGLNNGFSNNGVFLIKYDGLNLVKVDDKIKDEVAVKE